MTIWLKMLFVASGGALGALARWAVGEGALRLGYGAPIGTLAVNLLGCFLIGVAKAAVDVFDWGSPELRMFVFTGLLGAFTTFSTFESDIFVLWRVDERAWAVAYLFGSVAGGLAVFLLGYWSMQRLSS